MRTIFPMLFVWLACAAAQAQTLTSNTTVEVRFVAHDRMASWIAPAFAPVQPLIAERVGAEIGVKANMFRLIYFPEPKSRSENLVFLGPDVLNGTRTWFVKIHSPQNEKELNACQKFDNYFRVGDKKGSVDADERNTPTLRLRSTEFNGYLVFDKLEEMPCSIIDSYVPGTQSSSLPAIPKWAISGERPVSAKKTDDDLLKRNIKIEGRFKAGTWEAVNLLANKGIPIGFEATENMNIDTAPRVILKSGTLEDILDSISEQDAFYTWEEVDGVINVFPVMDRDKRITSFLAKQIGPITIFQGDDQVSAVEKISKSYDGGKETDVMFHSFIGRGNRLGLPDKFDRQIDLPAGDIRSTLNKLLKFQPYLPLWTVMRSKDRMTLVACL